MSFFLDKYFGYVYWTFLFSVCDVVGWIWYVEFGTWKLKFDVFECLLIFSVLKFWSVVKHAHLSSSAAGLKVGLCHGFCTFLKKFLGNPKNPTRKFWILPKFNEFTWKPTRNHWEPKIAGFLRFLDTMTRTDPNQRRPDPLRTEPNRTDKLKLPDWVQKYKTRQTRTRDYPTQTRPEDPNAQG